MNNQVKKEKIFVVVEFERIVFLDRFDTEHEECEGKARQLQIGIDQQGEKLIQTVNNYKNAHIDLIEKHRRTYKQL